MHFIYIQTHKDCIQSIVAHVYPDIHRNSLSFIVFLATDVQKTNPLIILTSVIGRVLKTVRAGEILDIGKQRDKEKVV